MYSGVSQVQPIDKEKFDIESPLGKTRTVGRNHEQPQGFKTVKKSGSPDGNKIRFVTDSLELNSRHSESHSVGRSSQVKMDTIKREFSKGKKRRKYQSLQARRDKQKKKKNF